MDSEKSFFQRLLQRKLQAHILTYYATLFTLSFALIMGYGFSQDWKTMINYSRYTASLLGEIVLEKVDSIVDRVEDIVEVSASLIPESKTIGNPDPITLNYLFRLLNRNPDLFSFYIASTNGDFLEAINLQNLNQTTSFLNPSFDLPKGAVYALRVINQQATPPSEQWTYYDQNQRLLTTEDSAATPFDPRSRPWYQDAMSHDDYVWTSPYVYNELDIHGISCAKKMTNLQGTPVGVISADIALADLSRFLAEQQIGKTGKVFILNENYEVIIPSMNLTGDTLKGVDPHILQVAIDKTKQGNQKEQYFAFFEGLSEGYLVYYQSLPKGFEEKWSLMMIVSIYDVFGEAFSTENRILYLCIAIVIFSGLLVYYFSRRISQPIVNLSKEADKIRNFDLDSENRQTSNIIEIAMMDNSIHALRSAIRSFSKYVPKLVVKELMKQGKDLVLGGEKKELVILFSDIANFTTISEELAPETLTTLLESYFNLVSTTFLEKQGTIDKYIGDGIMAFWGAPNAVENPDLNACFSSLIAQKRLERYNEDLKKKNLPTLFTRIGINRGIATVGNFGTSERLNYTAVGDAVNTASRLQGVNKIYKTGVLISEAVYQKIQNKILARPLDVIEVKGKHNKIKIYEVMASLDSDPEIGATDSQKELANEFSQAYQLYAQGKIEEAKALFTKILEKFPGDFPTQLHLERLAKGMILEPLN